MTDEIAISETERLELKRLELERYKAWLDYRKFIWASVVAAITIAAIPPLFQLATAGLEYVKSEAARKMQAQQFRDGYVKDFLNTALNQNIELRIRFAKYFSFVSSEKDDWKKYLDDLTGLRDTKKTEIDKLEAEFQNLADRPGADAIAVNEARRHLDWAYSEVGYAAINAAANPRLPDESKGPGLSLDSISPDKQPIAQKILDAFAEAKFGQFQQVAALANAIAESALDPKVGSDDDSWGLFLLNRNGGFGTGYTREQLQDPDTNIGIVVKEALKNQRFAAATSLDAAVDIFVRQIARPQNQTSEAIRRQQIARQLLRS
ncbi:hypothetical protein [Rhizobium leguminosarum]|uniref:hypothetical protein n=1 Tax=Rhizobium leguminosarum TaxID=384 RepID=UPI001F31D99D|nr:hypothetical protein [Rhizobium leguminosarum]UIJ84287.1 hypothetical protein LZK78_37145 [Rhizobium leguminosarum]